jgi:hypothetical protein
MPRESGIGSALGRDYSESRFAVFSFLFACASIFYHAQQTPWFGLVPGVIPLTAAFAAALKPSSVARFAVLVTTQSLHAFAGLPLINTNRTMHLIVGGTILAALALETARHRFRLPTGGNWLRAFETPVRLELALLYFFAFWHKLNWDYLDPESSCGASLYRELAQWPWLSFLPVAPWMDWAAIVGSLVMEAALPVLLFVPRLRTGALCAGIVFHVVLGAVHFVAFSATMTALLFLFAPPRLSDWLAVRIGAAVPRPVRWAVAGSIIAFSLTGPYELRPLFYWIWAAWTAGLLLAMALGLRDKSTGNPLPALFPMPHPVLLCLPVLMFFNGASPYLGLKTEYSFAMYSNLRTEAGPTNHLILPRKLAWADYQDDLVRVIDSSNARIARLAAEPYPVPTIWLRRLVWEQASQDPRAIALTLKRDGALRHVENAESDPELGRPPTLLERKFLRFRDILPREKNVCAH